MAERGTERRGGESPSSSERALAAALDRLAPALARAGARIAREPLPEVRTEPGVLTSVFECLINAMLSCELEDGRELSISASTAAPLATFELRQQPAAQGALRGLSEALWECRRLLQSQGGELWSEADAASGMRVVFSLPAA